MDAKQVLKAALDGSRRLTTMFVADLSDADLLVRPVPNANHIAWQLGHLAVGECRMLADVPGAKMPELPAGFVDLHGPQGASAEQGFSTKEGYLALLAEVREATLATLAALPAGDLDQPNPGRLAPLAPTVGSLLVLAASHETMHTGQFTVVRRKLGKPVLF